MRNAIVVVLILVLALLAACAGPRLAPSGTTAQLPAPLVRRLDTPPVQDRGVPWPVLPVAPCDT